MLSINRKGLLPLLLKKGDFDNAARNANPTGPAPKRNKNYRIPITLTS